VKHLIDQPMGDTPPYSDVLAYLGNEYFPIKKKYLEIVVSMMKSVYQTSNAFTYSEIFAYEIRLKHIIDVYTVHAH